MNRSCTIDGCERPHFGRGLCNLHYYRQVRRPKQAVKMFTCAWCGERKPITEMRHPAASKGKAPSTCHVCRESHPGEAWCDYHREPHAASRFTATDRPIGHYNICVAAQSEIASGKRDLPDIRCAACGEMRSTWNFRGGRAKAATCRVCDEAHPGEAWCVDCAEWLPTERFTPNRGRWFFKYCKDCRTARSHGVTVRLILERQGSSRPECACCGSTDFLKVDHDHGHCPAASGCSECVRGYLCHECNTAEGLLRTAERAELLAAYMRRVTSLRIAPAPLR